MGQMDKMEVFSIGDIRLDFRTTREETALIHKSFAAVSQRISRGTEETEETMETGEIVETPFWTWINSYTGGKKFHINLFLEFTI